MKFIDHPQDRRAAPVVLDDAFEQLRQAFHARLHSDRARLTDLGTMLARATAETASIFEDIQRFAHKLRGAAVIFEAREVADAAKALELAATSASLRHAENVDPSVWLMLETLADRLAAVTGSEAAPIPAVRQTHASR